MNWRLLVLSALLLCVMAYGYRDYRQKHRPPVQSITAIGGESFDLRFKEKPVYLQADKRWGQDTIGGSGESMASVGCTVSSVSMALAHFGYDIPPGKLNALLKEKGGYTSQGWLVWKSVGEVTDGNIQVSLPSKPSHAIIDKALKNQEPVVANVTMNGAFLHWILIAGKKGNEYLIKDPLGTGKLEPISKFKSPIYAIRIIKKRKDSSN